jgi:hypothetical protein
MRRRVLAISLVAAGVTLFACGDGAEPVESPRTDLDGPAELDPSAVVDPAAVSE